MFVTLAALFVLAMVTIATLGLTDHPGAGDVVVIPGTKVQPNGQPSSRMVVRMQAGIEVYRARDARWMLVSGGRKSGWNEARVMADYALAHGIPDSALIVDSLGVDTWHTAIATRRFMDAHHLKIAVVATQYFHVPRTRLALERLGVSAPYSRHARYFDWRDCYSIAREVPAYVKYALRRDVPR